MWHEATPKESWPGTEHRQATQEPDLRRLHEALALSNLKYKNLFELAPVAYLFLSPAGQVQEANVAATRLFGQPAALLNGCHVQVFIRNEDRLSLQQHLERVAEGQLDVLEVRVLQSDGRQLPVRIRSTAMLDAAGAVAGLHMALMDVSAHVHVASSIGIAVYPEHGAETDALIRHADAAMFVAKEQGRDRVQVFDHALDARISGRVRPESELRDATQRNQLRIHY